VLGIFGAVAILPASIGLYGLMAYAVEQRTREFGIRLALGADFPALRNMIVRQAMLLAGAGIVIGLAAADGPTRFFGEPAVQREADRSGGVRGGDGAVHRGGVAGAVMGRGRRR
jgi:hypothetical protein